jgi:hypothetical protein
LREEGSPYVWGEEVAKHMLLKCPEMRKQRGELVCSKWLNINDDVVYRKIIICTNVTMIKSLGKYLFETKRKWETKIKGRQPPSPFQRSAGS